MCRTPSRPATCASPSAAQEGKCSYRLATLHSNSLITDNDFVPPPPSSRAAPTSSAIPATPAPAAASSSTAPPAAPNPRRTVGFNLDAASSSGSGYSPSQLAQLQAMLEGQLETSGPSSAASLLTSQTDVSLTDILTPTLLAPILSDASLRASLFPHLPSDLPLSSPPTESEILAVIGSSQFKDGVRGLDRALRTGALGGLVQGLGLPAKAGEGVEEFLQAIGEQGKKGGGDQGGDMETD